MPIQLKELYIAKNLEELNKQINTRKNISPKLLANSAQKLFDEAKKSEEGDRDEERAYLLYMRYLESVLTIRSKAKPSEKDYYEKLFGKDHLNKVTAKVESLSKSLKNRYDIIDITKKLDSESKEKEKEDAKSQLLAKEKKIAENNINSNGKSKDNGGIFPSMNGIISKSGTVLDERNGGDMTVQQLKNLIEQKATKILVLDCRAASDFSSAHINHPDCISIPCEILTPGLTANKLLELLKNTCPPSYHSWNRRQDFDRIILYDWNSSFQRENDPMLHLLNAMNTWDPSTKYKSKPFVLQGGIRQVYFSYPLLITNPDVVKQENTSYTNTKEKIIPDLGAIQYPNFDEDKPSAMNNRFTNNTNHNNNNNNNNHHNNLINSTNMSYDHNSLDGPLMSINRTNKPVLKPKTTNNESNNISQQALVNGIVNNFPPNTKYDTLPERTPLSSNTSNEVNNILKSKTIPSSATSSNSSFDKGIENEYVSEAKSIAGTGKVANLVNGFDKLSIQVNNDVGQIIGKNTTNSINEKNNNNNNNINDTENEDTMNPVTTTTTTTSNGIISNGEKSSSSVNSSSDAQLKFINGDNVPSILKNNIIPPSRPDSSTKPSKNNFSIASGGTGLQRPFSQETSNVSTMKLRDENYEGPRVLKRSHSNPNLAQLSLDDLKENEPSQPAFNRSLKPMPNRSILGDVHARRRDFQTIRSSEKAKTGLKNLGNTCYMNSIMQCVNHSAALVDYFLNGAYREHINNRGTTKGEFTREVAVAIQEMNMGHRAIGLLDLKAVLSRFYKPFRNYDQQDSHEFLTYLLDWMHEDLNQAVKKPLKEQKNDALEDNVAAQVAWQDYTASNDSEIVRLFCGQQKSSVRCVNCNKSSTTFDTFFILSIPIPVCSTGKKFTIQQCLDLYTSEEEISDWGCSNCKLKTRAKKKIDLWKLPPYLIIHFQRFYHENWWRKRLTDIEFPVELLDLNSKALEKKYNHRIDYKYDLYGVSNHYGTIEGGHYTAYCRKYDWAKFDDQEVLSIKPQNVSTSAGYILFYNLRDTP